MGVCKQADKALCAYGRIKRTKAAGGERTAEFVQKMNAAMSTLSTDDLDIVKCLYLREMTQERAAEALECDVSTISRRKRRILEAVALVMYPERYLTESGII